MGLGPAFDFDPVEQIFFGGLDSNEFSNESIRLHVFDSGINSGRGQVYFRLIYRNAYACVYSVFIGCHVHILHFLCRLDNVKLQHVSTWRIVQYFWISLCLRGAGFWLRQGGAW